MKKYTHIIIGIVIGVMLGGGIKADSVTSVTVPASVATTTDTVVFPQGSSSITTMATFVSNTDTAAAAHKTAGLGIVSLDAAYDKNSGIATMHVNWQ